jgi:hypothetical protein
MTKLKRPTIARMLRHAAWGLGQPLRPAWTSLLNGLLAPDPALRHTAAQALAVLG